MLKVVRGEIGSGKIYVPCSLDGFQENCLLDTGAGPTSVDEKLVAAHPEIFSYLMDIPTGKDANQNLVLM